MSTTLQPLLARFKPWPRKPILTAVAVVLGSVPVFARVYRCYRDWLVLGRGGIPHNFFGWLIQASLKLFTRADLFEVRHYDRPDVVEPYQPFAGTAFLPGDGELPQRRGDRPQVPYYTGPQRQVSEQASPVQVERMVDFLCAVAEAHRETLEIRPSRLEGNDTSSIWLRSRDEGFAANGIRFAGAVRNEIVHVHQEGSSHLTLSPQDARTVLARGWGQRHPASGVRFGVPWTYVFVYAPRNVAEWEQWKMLVLAACSLWVSVACGRPTTLAGPQEKHPW